MAKIEVDESTQETLEKAHQLVGHLAKISAEQEGQGTTVPVKLEMESGVLVVTVEDLEIRF